jgi:thiol-disulfide isomerase/thioredoxin
MNTERGTALRGRRAREAFHGAVALTLFLSVGCTSNRFRLANDFRIDRNAEIAAIDARTRQVPAAPTGLPAVPAIAVGDSPDYDVALNEAAPPPDAARVPAATYPPRAAAVPYAEPDLDAALAGNARSPEAGLNSRPRMEATPRPGPPGSLLAPIVDGPQLAGRVVNPYGRAEPNASIQVYDLDANRRLVAETASGPDGRFRAQNLEPGRHYEVAAATEGKGVRFFGTAAATPPDGSVVVRLEPEQRNRNGSTFGSLDNLPGAKTIQGLVGRPNQEPQPTSDNVRISAPRLVAANSVSTLSSSGSELSNAVAEEYTATATEAARLPQTGEQPKALPSAVPPPKEPQYQPPGSGGGAAGRLNFPIIYRDGTPGVLEQIPGDVILLDFWGTWCGPCKKAIPHLNDLHRKYSGRGLHIVGAAAEYGSRGEQLQRLAKARDAFKMQYTVVLCPGAMGEPCPLRSAFSVSGFPTFALIDRSGRVLFAGQGASQETLGRLDQAIGSYLASVGK